jgi:hypothetical protein
MGVKGTRFTLDRIARENIMVAVWGWLPSADQERERGECDDPMIAYRDFFSADYQ